MSRRLVVSPMHIWLALLLPVWVQGAVSPASVPPFQWLNITGLLSSTEGPPPLKDASIGYDEASRSLIVFGGEASSGVAQGNTYLLNLETLVWSTPSPPDNLKARKPPARSGAVHGVDSAASNRNGFIVVGGKGADGSALSDVYEYDFNNEFWSPVHLSPGGPSARWGASGGIDTRVAPVSDPVLPGPNNTFWYWGGSDATSFSEQLWRLNISGTLSSNLPDSAVGSWEQLPLDPLSPLVGQGGGVLGQQIVATGGCNDTLVPDENCAVQTTYVINGASSPQAVALNCPAPRLSPVVVPNGNKFSNSFASQMIMLLGTFNSSLWDDGVSLKHGEVAIMDVMTRSWTRILPAGDPGTSGTEAFPTPRAGAAAVMYPLSLVGDARSTSSDIIVFGGEDETGTYLSEIWLLRAYNAVVTEAQPEWSGSSAGKLETGINASGKGVTNRFITSCASSLAPSSPPISSKSNSTTSSDNSTTSSPTPARLDTSILHKSFAPVSVALLLPSFLVYRHSSPSFSNLGDPPLSRSMRSLSVVLAALGYVLGIAALAIAFTTATSTRPLSTTHGRAGLALFVCLYGLVPLMGITASMRRVRPSPAEEPDSRKHADSDVSEKDPLRPSTQSPSPAASARHTPQTNWRKSREDSMSFDSRSVETGTWLPTPTPAPKRTFEVLNRPARTRRASGNRQPSADISHSQGLGDADWLNRRRSLTMVGELDSALNSPAPIAAVPPSTPGTLLDQPPLQTIAMPPLISMLARFLSHTFLLAFCVFTLVALWSKAPKGAFAAFLCVTAIFYVSILALAWSGKPDRSILAILLHRLRAEPQTSLPRPSVSDTLPETDESGAFPYAHRPPYRAALLTDTVSPQGSADTDDEDDDRAEEEMRRRDISMWTSSYPKRSLVITNPS
ncbi:hypothetical protein C8F01DRAFT_978175 [Mycena amicta]|nr:hypothetical protein C8F01DRAFT_978175 [Mycena amicta]